MVYVLMEVDTLCSHPPYKALPRYEDNTYTIHGKVLRVDRVR